MRARTLAAALLLLLAATGAAAAPDGGRAVAAPPDRADAPLVVRDDRGAEHRFARPVRRIVSLLPSLTESVCALGGCERLVGVDRFSDWPAGVRALPRLGGIDDAPVEAIVALHPDVVLASTSSRALERLDALGVPVVRLRSDSHADAHAALVRVAALLGEPARGQALWASIGREIDAAAASLPRWLRGRRVFVDVGGSHAAGEASFVGQTLARLGLANVVPAAMGPFPRLGPEFVLGARPDVVVGSATELAALAARPGWAGLDAVRARRVCALTRAEHDVVVRPGPRLGEAARHLAACLRRLPAPAEPA